MNKPTQLNKYAWEAVHAVKYHIDQQPLGKKSIAEMAFDAGIGRNQLQTGFKFYFGSRVNEYQKKKRMEAAAVILDEGGFSIQQISFRCGYESQSSFARAFKDIYGITPTEWQNRNAYPKAQ